MITVECGDEKLLIVTKKQGKVLKCDSTVEKRRDLIRKLTNCS